ncbi:SRPBCC domain-containing protein [Corynebacterium qintianiae]|uniref:SRPBCC domain-containing protein n=1 Tax=Corynebacterium qintianiae TaxID=2709392 RepID=A0A7T0KP57_9CORY|nr:SRPBCC domain-containing protein [Corynebacterium qintianiae]QPK84112.1 SRPBCC domain-containing protein [Corynebacterium qintianiae]
MTEHTIDPIPTGILNRQPAACDLMLSRDVPVDAAAAWTFLTNPEKTALWYGHWVGTGELDKPVRISMAFENGDNIVEMIPTECDRPSRLRLVSQGGFAWDVAFDLTQEAEGTKILFTHYDVDLDQLHEIGPGWEFYLDRLVGAVVDKRMPAWDAYFPAQQNYYRALTSGN